MIVSVTPPLDARCQYALIRIIVEYSVVCRLESPLVMFKLVEVDYPYFNFIISFLSANG